MATVDKNFKIKNGLIVGDSTNLVNYSSSSPSNPFLGQLWINEPYLYAWSSASTWVLIGDGTASGGGGIIGGSASGTPFNIPNTLIARSASGSFQIGAVDFHTASPVIPSIGRLTWDDGAGTALLGLKGGNINLPIGQQEDALVYNGTGSALARGQVVRIVGAQGQRPRIDLAAAINDASSSKTFGIVAEPIVDGAEGFVTTFGIVSNINTAEFTEGASLWLSPSAGGIVSTMPIQPYHNVFLGYCLKSHASSGRIFVKIQNGYEISELHDVLIQTASNNHILSYNSASSLWMNKDLQAAIKEVDGTGSGIDADLLDGQDNSYFLNTSNTTQEKTGDITFHGTLTVNELVVSGSSTFIATQDLSVTDSLIFLASEQYTTDALDIGIIGSYGDGTTSSAAHYHASFARDASQNKWKLLSNGPAPVNNVIDYSDPSVEYGVLQVGAVEVSSSAKVNNFNADLLDDQNGSYYLDWTNTTNKPDLIIGVSLSGNTSGAASVTLTDLTSGQISITTNTAHAETASSIAGSLVTGTVNNSLHSNTASSISGLLVTGPVESANFSLFANSASSINWAGVTNAPDPIIGVNLTGIVTGAASATLTDLQNGQVSITTAMNVITNTQSGTSYSLVLSDAGDLVELNNASPITLVIPLNSTQPFPLGTKIDILQTGAGQVTASYVSGVTLNSSGGKNKLTGQWSAATLIKRGTDTWAVIGDLSA